MLKVNFFLRDAEKTKNPEQELTIYCQLALEGMKRDTAFSTKISMPLRYWWKFVTPEAENPLENWADSSYYLAETVNRTLKDIVRKFNSLYDVIEILHPDTIIGYSHIRSHYDPKSNKIVQVQVTKEKPSLEQVYELFISDKITKEGIVWNTQKSYRSRIKNIFEFFAKDKRIDTIRHKDLDLFEKWMISQKDKFGKEKYCRNYRNKHLTLVFDIVAFAVRKEFLDIMPLVPLNLSYDQDKPPQYLLPEQRLALLSVDVPSLEQAKDIAQFLMYTGFSWVDYCQLKSTNLIGKCWRVQRQKSDTWSMPILLDEAQAIIDKYGSVEQLPRPDDSDLNKELKYLAIFAGIDKALLHPLRISDFRETFASMLENEYMFEQRIVQVMMGHKNPRQIQSYSRLMPTRILYELEQWKRRTNVED